MRPIPTVLHQVHSQTGKLRRVLLVAATASLIVGVMWMRPVASADAASAADACSASFDAYAASDTILEMCGIRSFPLMARDPLPDGGSTFRYQVNGDDTLVNVPPAGFDATTADATTLAFYGIPPDPGPVDAAARAHWSEMASSLKFVAPPSSLRSPPTQFSNSSNWGGQVGLVGSYKSAYARYTEPVHNSTCTGGMASYWAGLGGWAGDANLAQNGTAQGVPGFAMDQAWYEILPASPVAVNLFATPGQDFEAFTTRNTSDGSFTFFWWNSFTDASLSIKVFSSRYSGKSAEFIAERVAVAGVLKPLYKFGTIHVRLTANNVWIGEPNTKAVLINGGGSVMVQPSDLDFFDKAKFDDVWKRCT